MNYKITAYQTETSLERMEFAARVSEFSHHTEGLVPVGPEALLARPLMVVAELASRPGIIGHVSLQSPLPDEVAGSWQQLSTLAVFPGFTGNGLSNLLVGFATSVAHRRGNHVYAYVNKGNPASRRAFENNGFTEEELFGRVGFVKRCGVLALASQNVA